MTPEKSVEEHYTKYEIARILGARALQLSMNAPRLLKIDKDKLEEIRYDSLKIAELEFKSGVLPITVKRPLPQKVELEEEAKEKPAEVIVKEETDKKEEKEEKKKEEKIKQAEVMEEMEVKTEEELEEEGEGDEVKKEAEDKEERGEIETEEEEVIVSEE